ncbi:MAG: alpha-amylase family glycosyl hydrolase [Chthoniobacterales bacterium]
MFRGLPAFILICAAAVASAAPGRYDAMGADEVRYGLTKTAEGLIIRVLGAGVDRPDQAVFVALGNGRGGSALVPPARGEDGSAVWLPFQADLILSSRSAAAGPQASLRRWKQTQWGAREPAGGAFTVEAAPAELVLRIPAKLLPPGPGFDLVIYLKDMAADEGMGRLYGAIEPTTVAGAGERTLRHFLRVAATKDGATFTRTGRTAPTASKTRIYQLLPRLFGNTNETRRPNGTLAENGSGKFRDLNEAALAELKTMGFTHLWLTGVLQQATATDYAAIGEPADDPDLLKGMAGSPYAIKDYFDLCPDYADDPAKRLDEFKALLGRIHAQGMKVLVDFVPNHVARSYQSTINPKRSFGASDERKKFFDPQNNFFYLTGDVEVAGEGPPLRLPTVDGDGRPTSPTVQASAEPGDGLFAGESDFGRVTGNDVISWAPKADTWYETVKLNYGYDFHDPAKATRRYPHGNQPDLPVPDTWKKMDEIIAYWQGLGVDGFRADMAHMVPPEFWRWMIGRARERKPGTYFVAEAYETDPAKVPGSDEATEQATGGGVMLGLLNAGFDAVYDDPTYDALKLIYDGDGSANDLDQVGRSPFFFDNALQYAENHDEVRLAARSQWAGLGPAVGRPVSALLFGLSRGPVMVYSGQEVGEPAEGVEGFGGDDARTTIFDYWSMPELVKWVHGGKFDGGGLSDDQRGLRDFYRRLLAAVDQPAFRDGGFYPLNPDNLDNAAYGRVGDEVIGRWLYSYLRYDPETGQRMLVVVNLHPTETLRDVRVLFPRSAMRFLGWDYLAGSKTVPVTATDRLGEVPGVVAEIMTTPAEMQAPGFPLAELPPLTAGYFELQSPMAPPGR